MFQLPRSTAQDVDKLLGKRGTPSDRHTLAREDLLAKLASVRQRLSSKSCAWDEITAMTQWVLGGILGYGPLLGVPSPADLHREDAALHRLLHASLGVRSTAERVSFSASRSVGGLGAPLVTELLVSAVAADLQVLLNGTSQAAEVARDSLRLALHCPPAQLHCHQGMLLSALHLLAGYGLYLSLSTDRFICRLLDNLAPPNPHPLHGPYLPTRFQAAAQFARCSVTANAVRTAWQQAIAQGIPPNRWGEAIVWRNLLPEHAPVSHSACATAARKALAQSHSDWLVECSIFHVPACPVPDEEWSVQAWDDPWSPGCDLRSNHLLSPEPPGAAYLSHEDQALYGDGGYSPSVGATFCCQARGFGAAGEYWNTSSWASRMLSGRLPARYGWEPSTIHTAELQALVCSLRFRAMDRWHLLVFDRSSLAHALRVSIEGSLHQLLALSCCPLVLHLKRVLQQLGRHWTGNAPSPSWRQHQEAFPQHWNSSTAIDGRPVVTSRIAFQHQGVVGLDIKSHQSGPPAPFPILVQGNEVQDQGCDAARRLPLPGNIRVPSGGPFAWYSDEGHMVTSPIRVHVRNKLRQASAEAWGQRAVQGQMPRLITEVFRPALDPALYTRCAFSESWYRWALSTDHTPHDLSAIAFRCQRAIGGSWTERVHAHEDVAALARHWSQHAQWPSTRTCPLCRSGPGTPRHVVMACGALAPLVDMLRDDIEAELQQVRPFDILVAAAQKWRTHVEPSLLPAASPAVSARWPVLSAWR